MKHCNWHQRNLIHNAFINSPSPCSRKYCNTFDAYNKLFTESHLLMRKALYNIRKPATALQSLAYREMLKSLPQHCVAISYLFSFLIFFLKIHVKKSMGLCECISSESLSLVSELLLPTSISSYQLMLML